MLQNFQFWTKLHRNNFRGKLYLNNNNNNTDLRVISSFEKYQYRAWSYVPQSPRGFSALAHLYYLAHPTKTAMLRMLIRRLK